MGLLCTGGGQGKKSAAEALQAMAAENEAVKPRLASAGAIRPLVQMVKDGESSWELALCGLGFSPSGVAGAGSCVKPAAAAARHACQLGLGRLVHHGQLQACHEVSLAGRRVCTTAFLWLAEGRAWLHAWCSALSQEHVLGHAACCGPSADHMKVIDDKQIPSICNETVLQHGKIQQIPPASALQMIRQAQAGSSGCQLYMCCITEKPAFSTYQTQCPEPYSSSCWL